MKELSRKIFFTICGILTLFLIVSMVIVNVENYRREYENVSRNLNKMGQPGRFGPRSFSEEDPVGKDRPKEDGFINPDEAPDTENIMFMDYEVYTVDIVDNKISRIISHGNESDNFDVQGIASNVINKYVSDKIKIGNLYTANYSFNYKMNRSLIIVNNSSIKKKLRDILIVTLILFILFEAAIIIFSKVITGWIIKPAKEAFRKQKEFIADASHELKTPIAVIMASSDELSGEKNQKYIDNIRYESERMNKLLTALLDLSKLENESSKEEYKEENISKIVEKMALVFEGVAFEQGVSVNTEIESGLKLRCNQEDIERLVSILIDNAIKHSYKDSEVRVEAFAEKNSIVIQVVNHGDPIEEGDEEKIFERFYRADKSRNRNENRYGLGLAIAKRIVLNHGGTIKASSKKNVTTFEVRI
ncbi:sensor histidine kinase [Eubacterium ruminantium]|uniref:sensor histidine kinase n=1 Tax=Eubacterium ruminantium TaxID=42322 RepID=UPI00156A089B|nr:HAMP domain-containing sensor histidine kinase [Eubacterium ruminantium]